MRLRAQAIGVPYTSLAKPLPKQPVDKGRIWTILVGGAAVLFTSTVLLENYEAFFPAIARANKAMALSRKKAEVRETGTCALCVCVCMSNCVSVCPASVVCCRVQTLGLLACVGKLSLVLA